MDISGGFYMCTGCGVLHCEGFYCWKHQPKIFPDMVRMNNGKIISDCLHDNCPRCHGSGIDKINGGICVHGISCNCDKCGVRC